MKFAVPIHGSCRRLFLSFVNRLRVIVLVAAGRNGSLTVAAAVTSIGNLTSTGSSSKDRLVVRKRSGDRRGYIIARFFIVEFVSLRARWLRCRLAATTRDTWKSILPAG